MTTVHGSATSTHMGATSVSARPGDPPASGDRPRRFARPLASAAASLLFVAGLASGTPAAAASCNSLVQARPAGGTIDSATIMAPFSGTDPVAGPFSARQSFCRIRGTIAPAIHFEVWLPDPVAWNGKLEGAGNGGVAGSVAEAALANAIGRGYAGVSSDLGHEGAPGNYRFAIGRPDLVADWGHRATHEMTVVAKAMIAAYYGRPAEHAYFVGCSGGGRQALMEAQRYPADYDGIVAGDPTSDYTRLTLGGRLWTAMATLKAPGSYIPAAKIPFIAAATAAACDGLDGVRDGVIDDPRQCHFDPAQLLCHGQDGPQCLTTPQVDALRAIYAGSTDSRGHLVFPGYMAGGELGPMGWATYVAGTEKGKSVQYQVADSFTRQMVKEDPGFDPLSFDYDRDLPAALARLSGDIDAVDPNLRAYRASGGKLIQYHGWSDPGISPLSSVYYYENVVRLMGHDVPDFYRLFMVPGMQHCLGGPGTDHFDALTALERWVEQRQAPASIPAAHITGGAVDRTRPLCPYPQRARWKGTGSTDLAENFICSTL